MDVVRSSKHAYPSAAQRIMVASSRLKMSLIIVKMNQSWIEKFRNKIRNGTSIQIQADSLPPNPLDLTYLQRS